MGELLTGRHVPEGIGLWLLQSDQRRSDCAGVSENGSSGRRPRRQLAARHESHGKDPGYEATQLAESGGGCSAPDDLWLAATPDTVRR